MTSPRPRNACAPLPAARLLEAWERGADRASEDRALELLAAAHPETPRAELARLPVGRRDALLLELRERAFGPRVAGLVTCPGCAGRLELGFELAEIRSGGAGGAEQPLGLALDDFALEFRLPNTADLMALASGPPARARTRLLERCVLSARRDGADVPVAELPEDVVAAVERRMAEADPQADVWFDVHCPACERVWEVPFDIGAFLWAELDAWAQRALHDVHVLARAYGWTEADVLALSARRRETYLALVTG